MKISLKQASGLISFILICGLLTSCGGNQVEAALKANCDRIFKNLKEMRTLAPGYADEGNVARLLGEKTRKATETNILAKFP